MADGGVFRPGTPCWIDVSTADPSLSRDFYGGLFGWTFDINPDPDSGYYTHALLDGDTVAGLGGVPVAPGQPVAWTLYLATDDIAHTADLAATHGGSVLFGPAKFPGQGSMAIVSDPTGGQIGLWQLDGEWSFHGGSPGTLCWAELNTHDGGRVDEFFTQLFGYQLEHSDPGDFDGDFDYATWSFDDEALLGRLQTDDGLARESPAHWMVYFSVAPEVGTDRAVDQVVALGGSVVDGPYPSTFGRIAVVRDPGGAVFSLVDLSDPTELSSEANNDDPYDD